MRIAFAGNPNSGKTTMYNALTGKNERVGNWAGVTIGRKESPIKADYANTTEELVAVDLPGAYSMSPFTPEESITSGYVRDEHPDAIINIVDATNLSRSLFFTTQLLELGIPVVVALNKSDINEKQHTQIDVDKLAEKLGCPVIKTVSTDHKGLQDVVKAAVSENGKGQKAPYMQAEINLHDKEAVDAEDRKRFAFVNKIVSEVEQREVHTNERNKQDKIDAVITNKNIIIFETISFTNPTVNNSCSMEATISFYANGIKLNLTQGYIKAPKMEFQNGVVNLNNGSMLEATTRLDIPPGYATFYGKGENTSMIKSPIIAGQGFTYDGNLAIESDNHVEKSPHWTNFHVQNGAYITKIGESKVTIEVCTGTKNEGNKGEEPEEPKFPIIVDDTHNYAYLFEDQWPLYGDYDMNDLVMIIKERTISLNKNNKVEEFKLSIDLAATGATKSIGAAIMLDGVPASAIMQPVEFSDNSLIKSFNLNSNKIENGQDYAVIPLFDDAHKALGRDRYEQINTFANHSNNTNVKNISFTIKLSNLISPDELNINKLNVFIFVEGNRNNRKEIHVIGYQPTKLANTDLFGGNNDNSSVSGKKYYISKDNLAWGIMVPTDFKWALEYVNIKTVYSLFTDWVTSGGVKNQEWWKTFDSSKVYK